MKPLNENELNILSKLILRLFQTSDNTNIKRVSKSLFNLLTIKRFTTDDDLPIIKS